MIVAGFSSCFLPYDSRWVLLYTSNCSHASSTLLTAPSIYFILDSLLIHTCTPPVDKMQGLLKKQVFYYIFFFAEVPSAITLYLSSDANANIFN